ncbi:hypothetical protein [Streptomyces jumonjinensis]|uniref:hypothetical protein n=1 Tax=Streptomyces jumonjinensis TaxID=1945 RepID=UPI0037A52988
MNESEQQHIHSLRPEDEEILRQLGVMLRRLAAEATAADAPGTGEAERTGEAE